MCNIAIYIKTYLTLIFFINNLVYRVYASPSFNIKYTIVDYCMSRISLIGY